MRKIVLLCVALLIALTIKAQYTTNQMEFGKYADGTPLKATFIGMTNKFSGMHYTKDYLQLQDLKDGQITNYVLDRKDLHEIARIKNIDIYLLKNGYFKRKSSYKAITFCNFEGKKLYSIPVAPLLYNDSLDVVIGQNYPSYLFEGNISAYRISTGQLIWKQKLPHRHHWPWFDFKIDKNIHYLITDSLVKLDIVTGKTIKMPFTAGVSEPMKSRFSLVKNRDIVRRDWQEANYCLYPFIADFVLSGTHSNMIFNSDSIFIADVNNLYCLDEQLNQRWVTPLPKDAGAKSEIHLLGDKILLQNFGVAFQKSLIAHCGKPFVAVYDRHTGKELSVTMPDIKNKLTDGKAVMGRAYWKDDKGVMYNNAGETEIHRFNWEAPAKVTQNKDEEYKCYYSLVDTVYQYSEGQLKPIVTDAHQVLVDANDQDVYLLKDDGTQQKFDADKMFFKDSKNIYSNNAEKRITYLVVDSSKRVRCTLEFEGDLKDGGDGIFYAILKTGVAVIKTKQ